MMVLFEVQRDALDPVTEVEQLVHHALVEAVDAGHAVAHHQHGADVRLLQLAFEALDLLLQDGGDFGRFEIHGSRNSGCESDGDLPELLLQLVQ
jgi:hypothetical protein